MLSVRTRHWLAHHLQSLITRIQADAYLMERKLSQSQNAEREIARQKASLTELSEVLRAYFDAQTILSENISEDKKNHWIADLQRKITEKHQSSEPLAAEVAAFLEELQKSVTQP